MRKTILLAAAVAIVSFVSCQKDELSSVEKGKEPAQVQNPEFVASIDISETKTTVNVANGKVSWETTDEITVKSTKSTVEKTATYKIKSIDGTTGKATFEYKSGETLDTGTDVSYNATFGAEPTTAQIYVNAAKNLYMTASATGGNTNFTFNVQCGLLKLNLVALSGGDEPQKNIKRIEVVGTPTGGTKTTYTLTCESKEDISSAKDFYIALPAGSYTDIVCYNYINCVYPMHATTPLTIVNNQINPVKFTKVVFNLLPGVFSVSATKKVRFTKGNLRWNGSAWSLYYNQYTCDKAMTKDLFWWTTFADYNSSYDNRKPYNDTYYYGTQSTSNKFFCGVDHTLTINGSSSLYTLSKEEWDYLINSKTKYVRNALTITVDGVPGVILVPDQILHGYSFDSTKKSYTVSEWNSAQYGGLVFLPVTGRKNYDKNGTLSADLPNNFFSYWASSAHVTEANSAYSIDESGTTALKTDQSYRKSARPIRLVKTINN